MHQSNEIWYLMARSLSGEASPEEEKSLLDALQQNSVLQQQYLVLKKLWENGQVEEGHGTGTGQKKVSRILQLAKVQELLHNTESVPAGRGRRRKRRVIIKVIMYTCLTGVVAGSTWLALKQDKTAAGNIASADEPRYSQVIATQNGSRTRTMLPDGTTVWLNAGSKISYDSDFAGATRDVKLEGEAYFDVTKNPLRPFIVHTAGIDIKVLGTVFNVRSYPEDKTVETTLIRGLVQVTRDDNPQQKPVILHPNEKLIVEKNIEKAGNKASTQNISTEPEFKLDRLDSLSNEEGRLETAWVYNRLEFRGDDFETLAAKLERWYNVSIVFEDEKVKELTFNGSFEKETVEQAFVALKTAAPFNYTIHGHEIKIKGINKN